MSDYEVIVAGASFAGLAVAAQLRGRKVLVLDRKEIGTRQTSACGTLVSSLAPLGLESAICQVHGELVLHMQERTRVYPLEQPYCTVDYARLCHLLWEEGDAEFALLPALGLHQGIVETPEGRVSADLVVDATGWRAALAESQRSGFVQERYLGIGVETSTPYRECGLHFWYYPLGGVGPEVGWAFPAGGDGHVGVGTYGGQPRLSEALDALLQMIGAKRGSVHGGRFPTALREPVVGDLFVVGDAAGQCLPLTAEGIRPALYFGTHLGTLLRRVLEGQLSSAEARAAYREMVASWRRGYNLLGFLQRLISSLPPPLARRMAVIGKLRRARTHWLPRYQQALHLQGRPGRAKPISRADAPLEAECPGDGGFADIGPGEEQRGA